MPGSPDWRLPDGVAKAATVLCVRLVHGKWHVLLGQSEVKNWLRSSPQSTVVMRYPGEWKIPGGTKDASDPSLKHTAHRELHEEFCGIRVPFAEFNVRLLNIKQTKVVRGMSYLMHNFVALADENAWLLDEGLPATINGNLAARRENFGSLLGSGDFWGMGSEEKESVAPEVRQVSWFEVEEAIQLMSTSDLQPLQPVNAWQLEEFRRYGISRRDPMYQTMRTLMNLDSLASYDDVRFVASQPSPLARL